MMAGLICAACVAWEKLMELMHQEAEAPKDGMTLVRRRAQARRSAPCAGPAGDATAALGGWPPFAKLAASYQGALGEVEYVLHAERKRVQP